MKDLIALIELNITCSSMKYVLARRANTPDGVEVGIALFETEVAAKNVAETFNQRSRTNNSNGQDYFYTAYRLRESLF